MHNKREKARNCKSVVEMEDNKTILVNPNDSNDRRLFLHDHSYWSTDGFRELANGRVEPDLKHERGHQYCDQVLFTVIIHIIIYITNTMTSETVV